VQRGRGATISSNSRQEMTADVGKWQWASSRHVMCTRRRQCQSAPWWRLLAVLHGSEHPMGICSSTTIDSGEAWRWLSVVHSLKDAGNSGGHWPGQDDRCSRSIVLQRSRAQSASSDRGIDYSGPKKRPWRISWCGGKRTRPSHIVLAEKASAGPVLCVHPSLDGPIP
jgi:hypothetical protein